MSENIRSEEDLRQRIDHLESLLAAAVNPSPSRPPLPPPPSSPPRSPPQPPPPPASTLLPSIAIVAAFIVVAIIAGWLVAKFYRGAASARARRCFCLSSLCPALADGRAKTHLEEDIEAVELPDGDGASPAPADPRQAATAAAAQLQSEAMGEVRQKMRQKLTTAAAAISGRTSPADTSLDDAPPADFDLDAAVTAAGHVDAALLSALSRGAGAYEVRALLKLGASPHAAFLDKGALALAARGGSAGVIDALLQAGAALDGKDARGWTPLMHAIDAHGAESRAHVIVHLLDAGAAVDVWGQNLEGPLDLLEKKQREQARRRDGNQGKTNELSLLVAQKSSCKRLSVHAEGPHSPGSLKTSPEIAYTAAAPAPTIVLGGDEETTAARHSLSPRVDAAAGLPPAYRSCASGEAHSPRPAAIAPISPTGGSGFLGSGLPPPLRDDLTSAERVSGEPSTATIDTGAGVSRASSGGGPSNV